MGRFETMRIEWEGTEYKVPPNKVMPAIAVIEEVVTLVELYEALATKRVPLAKISMAFGALLRYAGAEHVLDEDVYRGMFGKNINQERITTALVTLLALMAPPANMGQVGESASEGNVEPAVAATSKKRSKRRSAQKNSSRQANSGNSILSTSGP